MRRNKILIIIFLLLIIIGLGFLIKNQDTGSIATKTIKGMTTLSNSDFLFQTIENKKIEVNVEDKKILIKGMEDKVVFLKVFGWDCNFCKKEIPELVKLKKELNDSFEVVAIEAQQHSIAESKKQVEAFGINYHIVSGDDQKEFYTYLQDKYGWSGVIPLTIVLAKGGKVLAFELGAKSYSLSELMQASMLRN